MRPHLHDNGTPCGDPSRPREGDVRARPSQEHSKGGRRRATAGALCFPCRRECRHNRRRLQAAAAVHHSDVANRSRRSRGGISSGAPTVHTPGFQSGAPRPRGGMMRPCTGKSLTVGGQQQRQEAACQEDIPRIDNRIRDTPGAHGLWGVVASEPASQTRDRRPSARCRYKVEKAERGRSSLSSDSACGPAPIANAGVWMDEAPGMPRYQEDCRPVET